MFDDRVLPSVDTERPDRWGSLEDRERIFCDIWRLGWSGMFEGWEGIFWDTWRLGRLISFEDRELPSDAAKRLRRFDRSKNVEMKLENKLFVRWLILLADMLLWLFVWDVSAMVWKFSCFDESVCTVSKVISLIYVFVTKECSCSDYLNSLLLLVNGWCSSDLLISLVFWRSAFECGLDGLFLDAVRALTRIFRWHFFCSITKNSNRGRVFHKALTSCWWSSFTEHNVWQYSHGISSVMGSWLINLKVSKWKWFMKKEEIYYRAWFSSRVFSPSRQVSCKKSK